MKTTLFSPTIGDIAANMAFFNNFAATTNPGVSNDSTQGYSAGSVWMNVSVGSGYVCTDATAGAAVWILMGLAGVSQAELAVLDGVTAGTPAASKALIANSALGVGPFRETGLNLKAQPAPTAKTVSATLTAAEMLALIITVNQGAAGASALQLPLAADLDTALPLSLANDSFDFSVINISTVAAESASLTTNTGWTLVGDMDIQANSAATTKSAGRFRARKTGTGAWTLYRLS